MPKSEKTPAETLAEIDTQLRGVSLRKQEVDLQVTRLNLKRQKLLNRHPELAAGDAAAAE